MTSVTLQGRVDSNFNQYVTKFRVLYSKDEINFEHLETFPGLTNNKETKKYWFSVPIFCKSIRIQVLEYYDHPSLRFEFGYLPDYIIKGKLIESKNNETPK